MLVPNQRFENFPNCRAPNGAQLENVKEFNNRIFISSALEFGVPQFNLINIEDIDAVLISNYNSMLALPYLTKMNGFRASVYCTEPVMQFGKMLMEELTHYVKSSQTTLLSNQLNDASVSSTKYPLFRTLQHLSIKINNKSENEIDTMADRKISVNDVATSIRFAKTDNASLDEYGPPPNKLSRPALADMTNENETESELIENSKNDTKLKNYIQLATIFNITEPNVSFLIYFLSLVQIYFICSEIYANPELVYVRF